MGNGALVLLSGGLDSATAAAVAVKAEGNCTALTFAYGQRHVIEVLSAKRIVAFLNIQNHIIIEIPAHVFAASALSKNSPIDVPKNRDISRLKGIPDTYVPARNILFLSYALACAESAGIASIYLGVNSLDYSGYPDCRPEFIKAFETMANLGTKSGVEGKPFSIKVPLMFMKKWEIIQLGVELGMDYSITHSCYDPDIDGSSCGICDSCLIRKQGFDQAGIPDPTRYRRK